ncbi:MAG: chromo domain-containing protein, partial [Weeksellaceae bacterium]
DRKGRQLYLVKWTGYDDETWELEERLIIDSPEYAPKKIKDYKIRKDKRVRPTKRIRRN